MQTDKKQIDQILTKGVNEILPKKDSLVEILSQKKIRLYLGIDPTGGELHLGHAVPLRKLQQFADMGHHAILLIGNGTVKIGDPTGRDASRPVLTDEQIEENFQTWKKQASKILDFEKIEIVRNGDWLDALTFPDIIKLMAKTTVQQLMERDMFQERLKNNLPIHGHEIMYPMLQGYDSVVLDVDLEIGGNDQTFNMMMGRTLQKSYNDHEKWVLTVPLINGTDGRKMSKSYGNFVSLTENPIDMFGKLMRISDEMIGEYFTIFTDIEESEIEKMEQAMKNDANPMEFKKKLAFEITEWLHSTEEAQKAQEHFETAFQKRDIPDDISEVAINNGMTLMEVTKICLPQESNSNLRRLIDQGAVQLLPQQKKLEDANSTVEFENNQIIKIGKRKFFKLVIKN